LPAELVGTPIRLSCRSLSFKILVPLAPLRGRSLTACGRLSQCFPARAPSNE
jgi:hypothetical protein